MASHDDRDRPRRSESRHDQEARPRFGRDRCESRAPHALHDRGVIWGINYLWLDAEGRMAMFATGGGGGLSFKTVRAALLPLRDE